MTIESSLADMDWKFIIIYAVGFVIILVQYPIRALLVIMLIAIGIYHRSVIHEHVEPLLLELLASLEETFLGSAADPASSNHAQTKSTLPDSSYPDMPSHVSFKLQCLDGSEDLTATKSLQAQDVPGSTSEKDSNRLLTQRSLKAHQARNGSRRFRQTKPGGSSIARRKAVLSSDAQVQTSSDLDEEGSDPSISPASSSSMLDLSTSEQAIQTAPSNILSEPTNVQRIKPEKQTSISPVKVPPKTIKADDVRDHTDQQVLAAYGQHVAAAPVDQTMKRDAGSRASADVRGSNIMGTEQPQLLHTSPQLMKPNEKQGPVFAQIYSPNVGTSSQKPTSQEMEAIQPLYKKRLSDVPEYDEYYDGGPQWRVREAEEWLYPPNRTPNSRWDDYDQLLLTNQVNRLKTMYENLRS